MERFNIEAVNPEGWIIVSGKGDESQQFAGAPVSDLQTTELGYSTDTIYARVGQNDYNVALRGFNGLRKFDEMRRSDGSVKGALRLLKAPVLAARWFVEPASNSKQDQKVAEFIQNCLTKYMTVSWPQLLTEILVHLDFGYYAFEKVFAYRDGKAIWQKWAPRHPMSIYYWDYDDHGGPNGCWAYSQTEIGGRVWLPINTLLVFSNDKEAGNIEGISALRAAYKHWYFTDNLYKIDAIQKERHGIGVPIIKLPPGFTADDKSLANEIGANLRTNEKAHIVLPPMWDVMTLKLEGQPVDALVSANHHRKMIYSSMLGDFAVSERAHPEMMDIFNKATRFVADQVRDVINKWAIPELVNYNWLTVNDYPELKVRRIGDTIDWQKISMAIRNLTGAGMLTPDDPTENWIRDEMDLPPMDPTTKRIQPTPQNAAVGGPKQPNVGPPKQSTAVNSQQGKRPTKQGTGTTGRTA
jgi:hypothetical protein